MNHFQRARTDEQRAARREAILDVTRTLVARDGVAGVSLNSIAREVGLAKSNVLRYFESREAILLHLLGQEYAAWVDEVAAALPFVVDEDAHRGLARTLASTILRRPLLCDLLASAPTVLEQNLSAEVALAHRAALVAASRRLLEASEPVFGPLDKPRARGFLIALHAFTMLIWTSQRPSPGMAAALDQHPELRPMSLGSEAALRELLHTQLIGMAERDPASWE